MAADAPSFWWSGGPAARLLAPVSWLYGFVAGRRMDLAQPVAAGLPVICVGNFTLGGSGKTPTVAALAEAAKAMGLSPGILSRGHGGELPGPVLVDPSRHTARDAGDEPLLLARHAPVAVDRNRLAGARLLEEAGCDIILMDDGFQSRRLRFDLSVLVVDGRRGVGNGQVFPAGPLRAPLSVQLRHADILLSIGDGDGADWAARQAGSSQKQLVRAELRHPDVAAVAGKRVLAFCGIGDPEKFFASLRACGADVAMASPFPDHHFYTDADAEKLLADAATAGLIPVTTAKDAVRLTAGRANLARLRETATVLEMELGFAEANTPGQMIGLALERFRSRV